MYEDLVKSLKICGTPALINEKCIAFHDGCCEAEPVCMYELMRKAADAIEELSKKRVGTWHRVKASQRSYSFVCNSCGFMYPYLTRCCPNCGVEYIDEEPPKEGE